MISQIIRGTERVTTHHTRHFKLFGFRIKIWSWTTVMERPFREVL